MIRKVPLIPTLLVLAAVGAMVALGIWQLQRRDWKEAMLARYERAETMSSDVPWPVDSEETDGALYRHSRFTCAQVLGIAARAGRSLRGESGWVHEARCRTSAGGEAKVAIGWSRDPQSPQWAGGEVAGFVAPSGEGIRLNASPAQAGLAELAAPDPRDIPNNHFAYAIQWFLFAATALAIYALALRKRWRG